MSGISSGIGLISGINTQDLIDQLIQIEARPVQALQRRVVGIDVQRLAFSEISARLLAVQNSVLRFKQTSFFRNFSAQSTHPDVVSMSAGEDAQEGSFSLRVRSLVTNHSLLSRGFADSDRTPVGSGTITVERAKGSVGASTALEALNAGQGVHRGVIRITNRSGNSVQIDLSTAITVSDVLDAINSNRDINVQARVTGLTENGASGDRIVIEDRTGGTGRFIVEDVAGGSAALDLGIRADTSADRVDGRDLIRLTESTPLAVLNDGNGVGNSGSIAGDDLLFTTRFGDFRISLSPLLRTGTDLRALNSGQGVDPGTIRITDRTGKSADINLSEARTIQDVLNTINAADVSVTAEIGGSGLRIIDNTGIPSDIEEADVPHLKVEELTGTTAADLGILGNVEASRITGRNIYRVETLGDVLRAINYAPDNNSFVEASIASDGKSIVLVAMGLGNTVKVEAVGESTTLADLGLAGAEFDDAGAFQSHRLISGLNTVLLSTFNGGSGFDPSSLDLGGADVDFSKAKTLQDVIDLINQGGSGLEATISDSGLGITVRNQQSGEEVVSVSNLQRQYVVKHTKITDFVPGGLPRSGGEFRIIDSKGTVHTAIIGGNLETVGQIIQAINAAGGDAIEARINHSGDGILVVDKAGGNQRLTIEDIGGGTIAKRLYLAGTAQPGEAFVDGSAELRLRVGAGDTLSDIANQINQAGRGATASILNDGGESTPFRLTINSNVSGRRGELFIDSSGVDLGLSVLTEAQDAVVTIGGGAGGASNPILVTSSSNTFENVIRGVTFEALDTSDEEITVTTTHDLESTIEGVQAFVDAYNDVQDSLNEQTVFNSETLERGPLLGDPTVNNVRTRLQRLFIRAYEGVDPSVDQLSSIGFRQVADNKIAFDTERFREAYEADPQAVEQLFTTEETGLGAVLEETLGELTRSFDGVFARKNDLLTNQQDLLNDQIERLNVSLDARRARLEAQFAGLETALASLQAQQNSLASLAALAQRPIG